jgi:hypothetical protein
MKELCITPHIGTTDIIKEFISVVCYSNVIKKTVLYITYKISSLVVSALLTS